MSIVECKENQFAIDLAEAYLDAIENDEELQAELKEEAEREKEGEIITEIKSSIENDIISFKPMLEGFTKSDDFISLNDSTQRMLNDMKNDILEALEQPSNDLFLEKMEDIMSYYQFDYDFPLDFLVQFSHYMFELEYQHGIRY